MRSSLSGISTTTRFTRHVESYEKDDFIETALRPEFTLNNSVEFDSCLASRHNAAKITFGTPWGSRCQLVSAHTLVRSKSQRSSAAAVWARYIVRATPS